MQLLEAHTFHAQCLQLLPQMAVPGQLLTEAGQGLSSWNMPTVSLRPRKTGTKWLYIAWCTWRDKANQVAFTNSIFKQFAITQSWFTCTCTILLQIKYFSHPVQFVLQCARGLLCAMCLVHDTLIHAHLSPPYLLQVSLNLRDLVATGTTPHTTKHKQNITMRI